MTRNIKNPHPGDILKSEFLEPFGLSQNKLAALLSVPANRIHHIVRGERGITAETDLRLCALFGLEEGYFLHLQDLYDMMEAKRKILKKIEEIKQKVRPEFVKECEQMGLPK